MQFDPTTAKEDQSAGFDPATAKPVEEHSSTLQRIVDTLLKRTEETMNLGAGAIRGAGSIGATILAPFDAAARAMNIENSFIGRRDRRDAMTEGLRSMGADPESGSFQVGKIGGEVAGTLGVGGALASGARLAGASPAIVSALQTAGMTAGPTNTAANLATRVGAGAVTGGVSAGIVDPENAGTGAVIGGALPVAARAANAIMGGIRQLIGLQTGAGETALSTAYSAGQTGGRTAQKFTENMRGKNPVASQMTEVLDDARKNLATMRQIKSDEYVRNMAPVKASTSVIDMTPIEQSVTRAMRQYTFKGQAKDPKVLEKLQEVKQVVDEWKALDPAKFHTAEGLDALKQRIGSVMESVPFNEKSVRKAIGGVYKDVWDNIQAKAPEYAKAMRDYETAASLIDEIEKSLSIGQRASADTAMRKLQSVLRNNVQTNYGARTAAMEELERQGGRELMPALAGQALNQWTPRGMQRAASSVMSGGLAMTGNVPAALGIAAASSPRIMGETAYAAGQASRYMSPLEQLLYRSSPVIGSQTQ